MPQTVILDQEVWFVCIMSTKTAGLKRLQAKMSISCTTNTWQRKDLRLTLLVEDYDSIVSSHI